MNCEFIVTPRILFSDKNLSRVDIDTLSLIISLALNKGYCYATNDYLKDYLSSSVRTISYSLSKLRKLNYIIIEYENGKRKIFLNMEKVPIKVADNNAKNSNNDNAKNCTHNINSNKYKKNKIKDVVPYWMEHPEVCVSEELTAEELKEIEEMFKEFK